jgi:hypothetical protein
VSDDRQPGEPEAPEGGVFGNLPDARIGSRSPRRDAASAGAKPKRARAAAAPEGPAKGPEPRAGNGLEDLAWAGVAAAAEAATIGVRLASRAMEALRDGVDRR